METGRFAQAEKLLIEQIVQDKHMADTQDRGLDYFTREHLKKLALVYYEAGRWSDILVLLEKVPGWGAKDLAQIASERVYLPRRTTPHLDLIAARALAETGQIDEAIPVLNYALQEDSGNDAAYALLLKIGKGDLVAKLDALYAQDQFEERPLIWKAVVLLKQGNVAEAESACKAAIVVDPSDGETGKNDRMKVYSVMADICDAKKDAKQAEFFRNVVKAIRLSENADDYYDAGLLKQAVAMYGQALDLFSDAYCIQSRIARQLAELGQLDEAAVHYKKAFELMPVSFGRLESHCFGCERAFKGKTAVAIAEKTFTEMMAKDPKKPQIPYLLGYLYMEEDRYPEALANFQKAAQLDPDYINAWKHIVEIGEKYQLSPDLRDNAVFNLLRLDPAGHHVTPNTGKVRQLDKLWAAEEKADNAVPPLPKTLLSLPASASVGGSGDDDSDMLISRLSQVNNTDPNMQAWMELQEIGLTLGQQGYYRHQRGQGKPPLHAVLSNQVISGTFNFL
jgi:tetratricopeptide (TPR) repeat protein